jgi:hypothetical protein
MPCAFTIPGRFSACEPGCWLTRALRPLLVDVGEYSRVLLPVQRLWGYQVRPGRGAQFRHELRQLARKTGARNRQ